MDMLNKIINNGLILELKDTVERIPKDLKIWKKHLKKLKRKKLIGKNKKIFVEYHGLYSYYYGKMYAYVFVLQQLGEYKYARKFLKDRKAVWKNRERGQIDELKTKREYLKHKDKV